MGGIRETKPKTKDVVKCGRRIRWKEELNIMEGMSKKKKQCKEV